MCGMRRLRESLTAEIVTDSREYSVNKTTVAILAACKDIGDSLADYTWRDSTEKGKRGRKDVLQKSLQHCSSVMPC